MPQLRVKSFVVLTKWRREVKTLSLTFTKAIVVLLIWQFSTSLIYTIWLVPSSLLQIEHIRGSAMVTASVSLIFLLSPLAGYLADVKFGRFKVLLYGTYFSIVSTIFLLVVSLLVYTVNIHQNAVLLLFHILSLLAMLLYSCGNVFFLANFIQFGIDQLRDAPTQCSILFLYAYHWCNNLNNVLTLGTYTPGYKNVFVASKKPNKLDPARTAFVIAALCLTIFSSMIIAYIVRKKQSWFLIDNTRGNSYKLVTNVILFAIRHKVPIRRSAFTFCENELPSRIDFGKRRYGGPYTTEQVEDVKVLINIVKVLISLGPVFLLEIAATLSSIYHPHQSNEGSINHFLEVWLLDYGMLSPLFTIICIPVYVILLKPFIAWFVPNFIKRMGLSIALLTILFLLYLLYNIIAYDVNNQLGSIFDICSKNISYILNWNVVYISPTYMLILQPILLSIIHMLLYIGAWEFISCQSPQQMKGILFGLFLAIRALFQFTAIILLIPFLFNWKSLVISCRTGFYLFNFCIGLVSLTIYTLVARRYKYRKRDDICNVYKFAEEYYSKY